ncbi:MAG: SEC-C domain-containing protein [Candidatus Gastranaerophilales bacterium]|nr:SEC-C domain-containing protein [Candidatus Gastranaerophilales bacterium]
MECFKGEIEGKADCIKEFLTSDKIPPSVIKYALEENENFFEIINAVLGTKFSNLEEILFNAKAVYVDSGVFSPVTVLFNSDLFSTILHIEEQESKPKEEEPKRNELCPCGSGLKYKKCCGKN